MAEDVSPVGEVAHAQKNDGENNETISRFVVTREGGSILAGHHFRPNPIPSAFREAELCINLTKEATILIDIFTTEGERVGTARLGPAYGWDLVPGNNCFSCGEIFSMVTDLVSGIYLYRLNVYGADGEANHHTGRFAVVN